MTFNPSCQPVGRPVHMICLTQEGRRELVLTGKGVEERVQKNGIDLKIFSLKPLNFLEVVAPFPDII